MAIGFMWGIDFMTERESRIYNLYCAKLHTAYMYEANFLEEAKEFIALFEKCVLIRAEITTRNGVADLLICYRGRFIGAELKRLYGKPSMQQLKFVQDVNEAGGRAAVCKTLKELWDLMV